MRSEAYFSREMETRLLVRDTKPQVCNRLDHKDVSRSAFNTLLVLTSRLLRRPKEYLLQDMTDSCPGPSGPSFPFPGTQRRPSVCWQHNWNSYRCTNSRSTPRPHTARPSPAPLFISLGHPPRQRAPETLRAGRQAQHGTRDLVGSPRSLPGQSDGSPRPTPSTARHLHPASQRRLLLHLNFPR